MADLVEIADKSQSSDGNTVASTYVGTTAVAQSERKIKPITFALNALFNGSGSGTGSATKDQRQHPHYELPRGPTGRPRGSNHACTVARMYVVDQLQINQSIHLRLTKIQDLENNSTSFTHAQ